MELRPALERRKPVIKNTIAVMSLFVLTGCGLADCNPADTVTFPGQEGSNIVNEIEHNYPGAKSIEIVHANNNPNVAIWDMPDGQYCTALASQTFSNTDMPGELIAAPYCRQGQHG